MQTGELNGYHYVYKPGVEGSSNVLVLLHGTGGNEHDLVSFAEEADQTAGIISLRGNVLEDGYARFFRRLAEGVFDEDDIRKRAGDIAQFIVTVKEELGIKNSKMIALGFSNGANIASSVMSLRPGIFDGAILLRAMVTLRSSEKEMTDSEILAGGNSAHPKVLLISGKDDQLVPEENANELADILKNLAGPELFTHVWLQAGHGLTIEDLVHSKKWLTLNFK